MLEDAYDFFYLQVVSTSATCDHMYSVTDKKM